MVTRTDTETKPWDLSHVLDFVNKLSSQHPPADSHTAVAAIDHAKAANNAACSTNAGISTHDGAEDDGEGVALGDFGKVWQFLGTPTPTKDRLSQQYTFASKLDYTSDGAAYTTARPVQSHRHPSFTDGTDGDEPVVGPNGYEKALTKTQKKRMRRKERKEKEAQEQQMNGNRPGAISESEADTAFGKKTPARKASAHILKDPMAAWNNAKKTLPLQYAAAQRSAEQQRKEQEKTTVQQPVEHKLKETFKKASTHPASLGGPRKYESVEYTVHGGKDATPSSPQKTSQASAIPANVKPSKTAQVPAAKDAPTSDEDNSTMQAVNAVAAAAAALQIGRKPPATNSPSGFVPRSNEPATPTTPVQAQRNISAQTQPVKRFGAGRFSMTPSSVQPPPASESRSLNEQLRAQALAQQSTTNHSPRPQTSAQLPAQAPASARKPRQPPVIEPKILRSGEDRHWALLMKLINEFGQDRKHLVAPMNMTTHNSDPNGIHVFVDASNIFIGFMDMLKRTRNIHPLQHLPQANMSFDGLALLMERRRPVAKRVLAGSYPWEAAFDKAKDVGYELNIFEKVYKAREMTERQIYFREQDAKRYGKKGWKVPAVIASPNAGSPPKPFSVLRSVGGDGSGTETSTPQYAPAKMIEQGVDEILHLKILESLVDNDKPSTIVLATGDAAQAEYSEGFMAMAERALRKGWTVELVSWSKNISKTYLKSQWEHAWDGRFRIIYLDDYAEELLEM